MPCTRTVLPAGKFKLLCLLADFPDYKVNYIMHRDVSLVRGALQGETGRALRKQQGRAVGEATMVF